MMHLPFIYEKYRMSTVSFYFLQLPAFSFSVIWCQSKYPDLPFSSSSWNNRDILSKDPWPLARSEVDDPLSLYFLHHSLNPDTALVNQIVTCDNYTSWSKLMMIALSAKNKLGFSDGSLSKPEDNNVNLTTSWMRNNNIVISWILNSVSKEIAVSIIFLGTAIVIWNDLKDSFMQVNGSKIYQLRKELINHRQEQNSIGLYFTKLKMIWKELNFKLTCSCGRCTCGAMKELQNYHQMEYVVPFLMGLNNSFVSFLMGLNNSFTQIRAQILSSDPIPPVNKIFSRHTRDK